MKKLILRYKKNIAIVGVLIFFCMFFLYNKLNNQNDLIKNGNFTIGKVDKWESMKGGIIYYYSFNVADKKYKKDERSGNNGSENSYYFVIFNPNDKNNSRILLNLPVPDSIKEAPKNSWKELPVPHDEKMIKKGFR